MSNSVSREQAGPGVVAISDEPLSVDHLLASLDDPTSGGLVLFVGRVRDHDGGKGVVGLEYAAHPSALDRLTEVCAAVAEEHGVRVAAAHRVGTLAIGDIAVLVATCSSHRGESFTASRALIDRLKAEVPIWKHQRFSDGSDEWVGSP